LVPPERLLRVAFLQISSSVRSERMLMEQLNHNLPFRWFVGPEMDESVWDACQTVDIEFARDLQRRMKILSAIWTLGLISPQKSVSVRQPLRAGELTYHALLVDWRRNSFAWGSWAICGLS
jgi:hypothetical protein